jgi:ADP-ribose pyrophosphatase YjhB (NUDIX family)
MSGDGPFLWFSEQGPPKSYHRLPRTGMCISAFVFVRQGDKLLLGKYADTPKWEELSGMDPTRWRTHGKGWTIPASHLKYGEEPRAAGRRVAEEILGLHGSDLSEPRIESDLGEPARFPGMGDHYDLWLFFDVELPAGATVERPAWWRELAFVDPRKLSPADWGRSHDDIAARWLTVSATPWEATARTTYGSGPAPPDGARARPG